MTRAAQSGFGRVKLFDIVEGGVDRIDVAFLEKMSRGGICRDDRAISAHGK
jgi:hypothetical protein